MTMTTTITRPWLLLLLLMFLLEASTAQRAAVSMGTTTVGGGQQQGSSRPEQTATHQSQQQQQQQSSQPMNLSFEGLKLELQTTKSKNKSRLILDGSIHGQATAGRLLAVMGPSGAGKSSILAVLARRIQASSKIKVQGRRWINGQLLSKHDAVDVAWIPQQADFFPYMTVRETLNFRAQLLHGHVHHVDELLDNMGLMTVSESIVGNVKVRGISGGERKRLSIAVELLASPDIIFLDEPTSGLDATSAVRLVQALKTLADQGKTIVAVIHQPSQYVFDQFDDLLLVSEGKLMYFGERTGVRSYMERHACRATTEVGTAEHVLDCISRVPMATETVEQMNKRMERLAAQAVKAFVRTSSTQVATSAAVHKTRPRANVLTQFRLLFQRSLRETFRGKFLIVIKLIQQISTGVIYGGIYSLGTNQASIQDRFGLLSLIAIGSANMAVAATIRSFPREKSIVATELASNNLYRTGPYFIGKALSELPLIGLLQTVFGAVVYRLTGLSRAQDKFRNFLGLLAMHGWASQATGLLIGSISPNSDVALALFPAFLVINIIFDGKNISEENTPKLLKWVPKLGLIRWGFEGLCVNEFDGLKFDGGGPRRGPMARTGADALARFGLGTRSLADVFRAQLLITGGFSLLSYLALAFTKQKYEDIEEPAEENES